MPPLFHCSGLFGLSKIFFFFSFHVVLGFCKSEVVDESEHFRSIMLTAVSVSVWWWPVSSFYLLRTME